MNHRLPEPDRPWMIRTYAGHSTAAKSNELYRSNLEKGQTGLSIAFDLPTQTGYDPDDPIARGVITEASIRADYYDLPSGKFARTTPNEITLCKNGGGAHLDLMTAKYILAAWRTR